MLPAPDESLWVGVLRLVLRVPGSRSLKDKRRAIASVRDRLRARNNLSVAEVGHLEDHTSSVLAAAMVANDPRFLRSTLDALLHDLGSWSAALVVDASIAVIRPTELGDENDWGDHG